MLHSLYISYYSLQSYSSSTGDATQSIRFLLFPVELQQLYRRCHTVYTFPAIPHCYSLQSYSSSTGDATQPIRFLLFPVELQQLYRTCYTVYTFPTIPCRATVALQEMLHSLNVSYYSLQSHSTSTGDATQSIYVFYYSLQSYSSSTGDANSLYVSYYSLQSYSSSTGHATQSTRFLLFPAELQQLYRVALQGIVGNVQTVQHVLQSCCSSTGNCRKRIDYRRRYTVYIRFLLFPVELQQLYRRCYTVYTFPTIPCRATVALQEMLHSLYVSYYSLQSYSSSTGDATQSIRFLLFPAEIQQLYRRCYTVYTFPTIPCRDTVALQEMPHSLYVSCYSTQSIRFLLFPVELQQLYRRCYTAYTFPTFPCRATVALQDMLHSLYVSYYSLQRYSSSTGDATQPLRSLLFPVELQQLYRRCYTVYTFPTIPCRDTVGSTGDATQSIRFLRFPVELQQLYRRYTFPTIPCRATVALQDATQSIRFLLLPVELQQLYRTCYAVYSFQLFPVELLMLHSLYVSYYSLQSYSSSTGDATQSIRSLLFFVELQQLYRRCYTVYTFPTFPCGDTVALQEMLHGLYVSYYSLQSYSSSTGDATQSIRFLLFPVEMLHSLYVPCRATVALQEMLHSLYVSQSYWRCYPVYTFPTIPCRATVALQEMLHSLYVSYYSLQSYCTSTGDATQSIRFLLFPVELQQLYRRCYTAYKFNSLQSYSSSRGLYVSYYSLQSCSSSMLHSLYILTIPCRATGDATQSVDLQWLYRRCYSSSTGDATQSIHFLLFPVEIQQLLQSHSSSTGDATQSIRFLLFPVALQQLYRRCCTLYRFPTIPCRATVALQEMLHSLYVSYYCPQSDSSSTGDATQSIRFLLFLVEMLHSLYVPCRATVALQEMLHSLYVSYYSLQSYSSSMLHSLNISYYSLQSYSSTTRDATQSVDLQWLYRRCYTVFTFPTIPCRAKVALQEMLHSLYVCYYSLQRYSSSTGDATQSICFLLFPVELQQLYRRCYTVYTFPAIPCRATVALQEMHATQSIYTFPTIPSRAPVALQEMHATQSIRFLLFPVELQQLYKKCYTV